MRKSVALFVLSLSAGGAYADEQQLIPKAETKTQQLACTFDGDKLECHTVVPGKSATTSERQPVSGKIETQPQPNPSNVPLALAAKPPAQPPANVAPLPLCPPESFRLQKKADEHKLSDSSDSDSDDSD